MTGEIASIKRRSGVCCVRLVSGEEFRFPSVLLHEKPLRVGRMVDTAEYLAFVKSRALPFALDRAVKMQAMREHTEKEVARRLRQSAYPEEIVQKVMDMLTTAELVSDERFAETWVRHRAKSKGRRMIAAEMMQKGVSPDTAQQALTEFSAEEELTAARKIAAKMTKQGKDAPHVMQALMRRGYAYGICRQALAGIGRDEEL